MANDPVREAVEEIRAGKARPIYLIHGEEFLARRAAEAICDALVPAEKRDLNYVQLDGSAGAREVAHHLDTIPMFRGTKAVFVEGADVLLAKRDVDRELNRAKELWKQPARKRDAARRVLSLVAPAGWTWRELDPEGPNAVAKTRWKKDVGLDPTGEDRNFFIEVSKFCADNELKAPKDEAELLQKAVTQGPPQGNHLVMLCEDYDSKHPVARAAEERGLILQRKVERAGKGRGVESLDIGALAQEVLGPLGKKLHPAAANMLKDRIGPAMRQMAMELEKLAVFVGDRATIEARDVELLVAPMREEEFYELGNALGEGDMPRALKLLDDELFRGKAPLQILGGLNAAVRRLAVDAARFAKVPGALSGRELRYDDYQRSIHPGYVEQISGEKSPHPYVSWLSYKRVRRLGVKRALSALALGAETDLALKTGRDGRLALEKLILAMCGAGRG